MHFKTMIKNIMFIKKLKASGVHLLLSLVVISLAIGLIITFWFPDSLMLVSNFKEIALLIISIDLVLGPLLTFIVFNTQKKALKFDLSVIATIQITALTYGLFTLYQAHPVYIAFNIDRFTLISAIDAKPEQAIVKEFKISKLSSPKLVVAKLPENKKARSDLVIGVVSGEPDIELRPDLYHPYEENISEILAKSLDPNVIFKKSESKEKLNSFIKKYGKSKEDYAYFPLEGASKNAVWVLDKKTAKPVDIIMTDPWVTDLVLNTNTLPKNKNDKTDEL